MDILTTVSTSIALAKRLRDVAKHVQDAEFKNLLADLSNELGDLKLEAAALKERIAALEEENALLKKATSSPDEAPVGRKWAATCLRTIKGYIVQRAGIRSARNRLRHVSAQKFVIVQSATHQLEQDRVPSSVSGAV